MNENTVLAESKTDNGYLISVVIPIYNREELIDKTVLSVLNQPCSDKLEIILVNDGSTDNSQAVCEKYASEHSNVRVINKPNGGVASARNEGIEKATGKYIAFLDCDDWWNEGFFDAEIAGELENSDIDIYGFSYYRINYNCKYRKPYYVHEKTEYYENNEQGRFYYCYHCSLIFSGSFLQNNLELRYPAIKLHEDICFCERCFYYVKSYKSINKFIFSYWMNPNSAVHSVDCEECFFEEYKGVCIINDWYSKIGLDYNFESDICLIFCTYLIRLCCKYNYKRVKNMIDKDSRLASIQNYKKYKLPAKNVSIISEWILHPRWFFVKTRLLKKPKEWIKNSRISHRGVFRNVFEFVEYRLIGKYEKNELHL